MSAPHIPAEDTTIIATLRTGARTATERELDGLRARLALDRTNAVLALEFARRCVERSRESADPRYLGQAQVALAPWMQQSRPPVEMLVLQATVKQSLHKFDAALSDLVDAVARDPRNAQAWLTKATIHTVRSEFSEARQAAVRLLPLADALTSTTAIAQIAALTGQADQAIRSLERALTEVAGGTNADDRDVRQTRLWAGTLLAETLARTGRAETAEGYFKATLALAPRDPYLLGAYADFLLDQKRSVEVASLLQAYGHIDGLLLRWAEATGSASARNELADRFEAARARGDRVHLREEARFELRLCRRPAFALALARENWLIQKEPADARILLESARAVGDMVAQAEVLAWVSQTQLEDVALRPSELSRR